MRDILLGIPWETVVYAEYISRDNNCLVNVSQIRKHGRKALSQAFIDGSPFMAKRKGNADGSSSFKPVQWVNTALADTDELQIEHWDVTELELYAVLINLVDTGHSLTLKPVPGEDSFMAAAIGATDDCPNSGLGLSAYADTPNDAIKVLVYKHHALHDKVWPKPSASSKRRFR